MIFHPDSPTTPLTDRFGCPVFIGAKCVIAKKKKRTYGGAGLFDGTIEKIVPLLEKFPGQMSYPTGHNSRVPYVREDQIGRPKAPTEYYPPLYVSYGMSTTLTPSVIAPKYSECYVAAVRVEGMKQAYTVPFGCNIILAPHVASSL